MQTSRSHAVIAAVRTSDEFARALSSSVNIIFDLRPDIITLADKISSAHSAGKKIFIHLDLAEGIGKDKCGIIFSKNIGIDGIISTRVNIIKAAREAELFTVQRFFIVDSHSINTTAEALKASKPDMIEVMPGVVTKIIKSLKAITNTPIIAGGLIETSKEISDALSCGASAVSTGKSEFWK